MVKKWLHIVFFTVICLLSLTVDSFAAENNEIDLGTDTDSLKMHVSDDVFRTEFETEVYETTCYREVYDGTTRDCDTRYENRCEKVPGVGDVCHSEPTTVCSDRPVYRQEPYSCTDTRTVAVQVYDHSINAKIDIDKNPESKNFDLNNCTFIVKSLNDKNEFFSAVCATAIIRAQVVSRSQVKLSNGDIERELKLKLDFADISGLAALKEGLHSLDYKKGILSFVAADLATAKNFALNLSITRNRFLLKDKVVFSGAIKASQLTTVLRPDGAYKVSITLDKIGAGFDASKKHTLKLSLKTLKPVDIKDALNQGLSNQDTGTIVVNN